MSGTPVYIANLEALAAALAGLDTVDRETTTTQYRANTNGTGYSTNDAITCSQVWDVSGPGTSPSLVATAWYNATTLASIAQPTAGHLDFIGTDDPATATLQTTGNGILTTIDADTGSISSSVSALNAKFPAMSTEFLAPDASAQSARWVPNEIHKVGFAQAVTNGIDSSLMTELCIGAGMTRNQTGGNLVVTTGTTANEEFLARSNFSVKGAFNFIFSETQSTRTSANNNIGFWLADRIGEGLSYTINSATSITVSSVPGTWSSGNVGQFMNFSCGSVAGSIPGRYAIASVSGSDITFTVSGFPGSGTGTCSLWGWNWIKAVATNTTTTNMAFSAQRKGWALADTTATISTITSGHMSGIFNDSIMCSFSDSAQGSQTGAMSARASRQQGVPDQDVELYVYLQALNTTTPVAITWTVDFFAIEDVPNNKVILGQTNRHAFNFFTTTGTVLVQGPNADDSSSLANPAIVGGKTVNSLQTASANNDTGNLITDLRRRLIVWGSQVRELQATEITTISASVTETTIAAAVASVNKDIKSIMIANTSATGVRVDIRDSTAGTIRLSPWIPATTTVFLDFSEPFKQTAASNNNWTAQSSGSVTDLRITVQSIQS